MLQLAVIENKRVVKLDGYDEEILELTEPSLDPKEQIQITDIITVPESMEGRMWAIAKLHYGDESVMDMLCFFNGISNPYSVEAGRDLFIPDLDSMKRALVNNVEAKQENIAKTALNNKLPEKDKQRFLNIIKQENPNVSNQPGANQLVTPNIAEAAPLIIESGTIVFGTNISDSKCRVPLSTTQTKSEAIRNFVKQKFQQANATT